MNVGDIEKRLKKVERQTAKLPSRIGFGGGGGGGSASDVFIEVDEEADLPNPSGMSRKVFGIVIQGVDEGMLYIINPAGDGWVCLTKFG